MRRLLNSSLFLALALPAFAQAFRLSDPAFMAQYNASSAGSAPAAPVALAASVTNGHSFTACWQASAGATGYIIDIGDIGFANCFSNPVTHLCYSNLDVGNVTSTNASSSLAENGTTYQYRVRSYNSYGTSANSSVISVQTLPLANNPSIGACYDNGDCTIYIEFGSSPTAPLYDFVFQIYDSSPALISTQYASGSSNSTYLTVPGSDTYTIVVTSRNDPLNESNCVLPATSDPTSVTCP